MDILIDFNSDEAFYIQLVNQIIIGIASDRIREGDSLPSVRQLADKIGINMHTVNKAYSLLKQDGFLKVDRRKGAIISVDVDKLRILRQMKKEFAVNIAKCICNGITKEEAHMMIDEIYDEFL